MKSCQAFQDWLESSPRLTLANLPPGLAEHANSCAACEKQLTRLRILRKDALEDVPPTGEIEKMWQRIDPALHLEDPTPSPSAAFVQPLFSLLSGKGLPLGAGVLALLLLGVGLWFVLGESLPVLGRIEGSGGELIHSSSRLELRVVPVQWLSQDRVVLTGAQSWAAISFIDGRRITVEGNGRLLLSAEGFSTEEGRFRASFTKGGGQFRVRVPGAILGIRGTTIDFDLVGGEGRLELIEGRVDVVPEDGRPAFDWKPQSRLLIRSGKLLFDSEKESSPATNVATESLRSRPAAY